MGAGRIRFMRGPSLTYASETTNSSTSTSSNCSCALAIAECRTFSTAGAIRLLVARSVLMAAPAFRPRIRSTTSRAFCGEIRMYRASAFASMSALSFQQSAFRFPFSRRLGGLLRRRLHRMSLECPRGRKFAQLVSHHVFGNVHRNEFLAVMYRDGVPDELGQNRRTARPGAHYLLLVGRAEHRQLGFQMRVGERSLLNRSPHSLTSSCSSASRS